VRKTAAVKTAAGKTAVARTAFVLGIVFILALTVGGCGGSSASDSPTTAAVVGDTTTTETGSVTTAPEATTTTEAPASGPSTTTASVSSTNGAYPKDNPPDWSDIKTVAAFRSASYGVVSIAVGIANYEFAAASLSEFTKLASPGVGDGRIELRFVRSVPNENEPPFVVGVYDFAKPQGQAELTGSAVIKVEGGSGVQLSSSGLEGKVEITAVSDTEVSGTFDLKDKWTTMSGAFTAPLK